MENSRGQLSKEEQMLEMQNALIKKRVDEIEQKEKLDKLVERADFYENLHNKERSDLYELELESVKHKDEIKALQDEKEALQDEKEALQDEKEVLKAEIEKQKEQFQEQIKKKLEEQLQEQAAEKVDNIGTKRLIRIVINRVWHKIIRR